MRKNVENTTHTMYNCHAYLCPSLHGGAFCRALLRPISEVFDISQPAWALYRGCSSIRSMERGALFAPFFPYFNSPDSCILGGIKPSVWNGLPLALRLLSRVHSDAFWDMVAPWLSR